MQNENVSIQHVPGFYRLPKVLQIIPVSRSSWWAGVKAGKYPAGIKISPNTTVWRQSDIHELCEHLAKGGN
jgi:predicted DNA-binding transcriptional regulator AlpA